MIAPGKLAARKIVRERIDSVLNFHGHSVAYTIMDGIDDIIDDALEAAERVRLEEAERVRLEELESGVELTKAIDAMITEDRFRCQSCGQPYGMEEEIRAAIASLSVAAKTRPSKPPEST